MSQSSKKQQPLKQATSALRRRIQQIDGVLSGTLHTRTKVCGRPNCRCAQDPEARHGPYVEWSRRHDNRLVHRILTPEEAKQVQRAIANYRKIQELLAQWEQKTIKAVFPEGKTRKS